MKYKSLIVLVVVLVFSLACGVTSTPSPTEASVIDNSPSPTNPPTVVPPSAAGTPVPEDPSHRCVGSTAQGYPITVTVTVTDVVAVTQVQFGILMVGSGWQAETTRLYQPAAPVRDGRFAFGATQPGWETEFDGMFDGQSLEGTLWVSHTHPQGFGTAVVETPYSAVCSYHGEAG